jgi:hypothetical protein
VRAPELIWDGEPEAPAGVAISHNRKHSFVEVRTRSLWAVATWAVSAIMVWFGLESANWILLALAPFMMAAAIMQTLGRVCVLITESEITVFEGVGGIGRRLEMPLAGICRVDFGEKKGRGGSTTWIEVDAGGRALKFGRHLNDEQARFVVELLRRATFAS